MIHYLKTILARYLDPLPQTSGLLLDIRNFLHTEAYERELQSERYQDPKRLQKYGYKVFSQSDEDGIIQEIFRRVGGGKTFIEIGVGNGSENNTLRLLLTGWEGTWIEQGNLDRAREHLNGEISNERLKLIQAMVTPENINALITEDVDFLSIDIDGNDYWVWQALTAKPKVVCIEYNSTLKPPLSIAQARSDQPWNGTSYMGASLCALEKLGRDKGYSLVGCNFTGNNAFFVRDDLLLDRFLEPYTSENHYEPPRYLTLRAGHPAGLGKWVTV